METEKLTSILQSLESFDLAEINNALAQAEQSTEIKQRLEKRYLKLIQLLLDDPNAVLADFSKVFATGEHIAKIMGDVFVDDDTKFEFVYFSEEEAKDAVDIIGGIVSNHINPNDYIEFSAKTTELNQIGESLFPTIENLKNGIDEEVKAYPQGWYGQICIHMMKSMIYGVGEFVVMKTWLKKANESKVLKEFSFFLAACSADQYMFIEFRNIMDEALDLTEMLWLYPNTPLLFYPKEYKISYPKCVLSYNRSFDQIRFTEFYEPDGSISVNNIIERDGLQQVDSQSL
ncbi:MAG: hypothetical protein QM783_20735 [Phycisphaerales bacterium]